MKHPNQDRVTGLNQHMVLGQIMRDVQELGKLMAAPGGCVAGNEDVIESLKGLGDGAFSVAKWVGGKTLSAFSSGIQAAGAQLSKTFDDNKSYIRRLLSQANKDEDHDIKLSAALAALLTVKGQPSTLVHDMDVLASHLDLLDKHSKDVLNHLDTQLTILRKLKNAKNTDDVFSVVEAFEKQKYPEFKLPTHSNGASESSGLPGGKVWSFTSDDENIPKYSMSGDAPTGEGGELPLSKSAASELLNKLDKINNLHQRVKDAYESYLSFIKSWSSMVKEVDEQLTALEYRVSKTALAQAEKLLEGDRGALAFYSGFTPRVVGYTDRYIHGVLGAFA